MTSAGTLKVHGTDAALTAITALDTSMDDFTQPVIASTAAAAKRPPTRGVRRPQHGHHGAKRGLRTTGKVRPVRVRMAQMAGQDLSLASYSPSLGKGGDFDRRLAVDPQHCDKVTNHASSSRESPTASLAAA
ncbi:hypothetical protein GGTG_13274 [Gaeumannomyces tritici R3-111a-1]|uniref:Uncharacterized protein n=1 Tax=Gaeumannomyces tritici (strain R3-111a-1) TaxID=644352 RepID=J3PIE6_GAET3|nr:hypothetical protein GGTG_13274 [Gaeumannomyces tritici R3-111a-1]EJT69165.1 hypothetical protein GGTG_13274 [Gaeumannomyces tritici R3-111a-1]